jgi:hypothetical protein
MCPAARAKLEVPGKKSTELTGIEFILVLHDHGSMRKFPIYLTHERQYADGGKSGQRVLSQRRNM